MVQSIAAPVLFGQVFQLVPPVMLITMLPISIAGWGVREATMGLAFGYAGLMANEGVNISLLFGAVSFIVGAFGGLVWIFSAEKSGAGREADRSSQTIAASDRMTNFEIVVVALQPQRLLHCGVGVAHRHRATDAIAAWRWRNRTHARLIAFRRRRAQASP